MVANGNATVVVHNGGNNNARDVIGARREKRARGADEDAPAPVRGAEPRAPAEARAEPAGPVPMVDAEEGHVEDDEEEEVSDGPPAPGATRQTRKHTLWIFVDRGEGTQVTCRCGCESKDGSGRLLYSGPNTGAVRQHMAAKHWNLLDEFQQCKNANGNWDRLLETIKSLNDGVVEKISKRRRRSDSFYSNAISKNLEKSTVAELKLLNWAVANRIPRIALDDVLFDSYQREVGVSPAPNRHTLQNTHLVELDNLVVKEYIDELASAKCVSLSADGYRDRARRDWINVTVYLCAPSNSPGSRKWVIRILKPDIIYLPESATAENISLYISEVIDDFVRRLFPLILPPLAQPFHSFHRRL